METIVQIAQLLLALSILVGIHEGGHMITARMFGMRVEKFFIGFPPRIFSFKKGDTEYGLGAIPLGGFVKISGMIDESLDKEQMSAEPQPWEFRSKPAWQRLIVMLGGIIVNVIAGMIAFIILTYNLGETYWSSQVSVEYGVIPGELGEEVGFELGDKVLKINGQDYDRFTDIWGADALLTTGGSYTISRNGNTMELAIPRGFINELNDDDFDLKFLGFRYPFSVDEVREGSNADKGGLLAGDKILSVDSIPITYFDELRPTIANYVGQTIPVAVERPGQSEALVLNIQVANDTTLGFTSNPLVDQIREEYTFGEAVSRGSYRAINSVVVNARALGKMFTREVSVSSLSGPIGIVKMFPGEWDWNRFWYTTGFISMILAFMNLLPIPALDGGHVVFLLFEIISGKAPSDKFLENAQKVGMIILLALMIFVFGNDILKLINEWLGKG